GNQGHVLASQLKASMAKPGYFHDIKIAFLKKYRRGLNCVLARFQLYHRADSSTRGRLFFSVWNNTHKQDVSLKKR
ncbi:MAG: hypothetical protein ACRDHZ_26450, partial [Ktedonobacteraceae bacterium]